MFRNLDAEQSRNQLTNLQMAKILGISRVTYEKRKKDGKFNRPQIVTLLKLFNCSFEYLFAISEQEQKPA